jgi:hypothetical protein
LEKVGCDHVKTLA